MDFDNPLTKLTAWYRNLSTTIFLVIISAIIMGLLLPVIARQFNECLEKGGVHCACLKGVCAK